MINIGQYIVVADGIHVPPTILRLVYNIKQNILLPFLMLSAWGSEDS